MVYIRLILGVFLALSYTAVHAQDLTAKIHAAFHTFENHAALSNGIVGFAVMDSGTGQVLFEHNSKVGLPTASTLKTITSITALDLLGADYRYSTGLFYTGEIDQEGTLEGDIIIEGSGDPTLGSDRYPTSKPQILLDHWVGAIKHLGIRRITGRIIVDDLIFGGNDIPSTWMWNDVGNYYGAGISGLNWKENKAGVVFAPSQVGQPTPIQRMTEDLSYLQFVNEVTTGNNGTGDNVYGYSVPYSNKIHLRGTYGRDLKKTIQISVPDPAYLLGRDLQKALEKEQVTVETAPTTGKLLQEQQEKFGQGKKPITNHESVRTAEIVHWFNRVSINLYGESLLKTIGNEITKNPSTSSGIQVLTQHWQSKLGISSGELRLRDGSGLSPQNRITPAAMLQIMNYARQQPWYAEFYEGLPTINSMKMKSGTIGGVLGYTGYQKTAQGRDLTFVLLVNNYQGSAQNMRQQMFKFLNVLKQ